MENIKELTELIKHTENFLKNKEERNQEIVLKEILKTVSNLIETVSEKYYQEILEGKNNNLKLLEFITFLKDLSVQLEKLIDENNKKEINNLLKFNLVYLKSLV